MPESIRIPARFNGPLDSGNGGYSSGVIANRLAGPAEVSLRSPVPLDQELEVVREGEDAVRVLHGDTLIADGRSTPELELEVPSPVNLAAARAARDRYRGSTEGLFSQCFVCGRGRKDAFGVFAGEVEERDQVASPWTPPPWTAGDDGSVRPELVWAVLDCPTYFAVYLGDELAMGVLARFAARIDEPVLPGREHIVTAWPLEADGRKRTAGAAVLSADGDVLATARALLIEPRQS